MAPCPPGLLSLPDDVLCRCLAELGFEERHRAVPLTCRRLSQLVNAPQLLRTVQFDSTAKSAAAPRNYLLPAQSFACWAVRHATGAVRCLSLRATAAAAQPSTDEPAADEPSINEPAAVWGEMMGVLAACGAGGSLQEVRLLMEFYSAALPTWLPAWLPAALRSVRLLDLEVREGHLVVDVPLAAMTALEHLALDAVGLHFTPAASLPPSLTRLRLGGTMWLNSPPEHLPSQVAGLPALQHLSLQAAGFTQQGLEPLTQLRGSLQELHIDFCDWPPAPATLASLTGLTSLDLYNLIADREEAYDDLIQLLEGTLAAVPQLRALRVSFEGAAYYITLPAFPASLTAMRHLQHLYWDVAVEESDALPPGAWLGALLALALPGDIIARSAAVLASAARLRYVLSLRPNGHDNPERSPFWRTPRDTDWQPDVVRVAASLPSVRRLDIEVPSPHLGGLSPLVTSAVAAAMQQNPALQIQTRTLGPIDDITLERFQQWAVLPPS